MRALEIGGATLFTAALYWSCSRVQRLLRLSLLHPLLLSVLAGGTLFALLPPSWLDAYVRGSAPLLWLLGPATAALALPFYRQRAFLAEHPRAAVLAAIGGWREHGGGGVGPRCPARAPSSADARRLAQVGHAPGGAGAGAGDAHRAGHHHGLRLHQRPHRQRDRPSAP